MGITAAATDPRWRRSNTSAERAHGTTVHRGSMRSAASWLKEPSSPWMATWMAADFITGKVAGDGGGVQIEKEAEKSFLPQSSLRTAAKGAKKGYGRSFCR